MQDSFVEKSGTKRSPHESSRCWEGHWLFPWGLPRWYLPAPWWPLCQGQPLPVEEESLWHLPQLSQVRRGPFLQEDHASCLYLATPNGTKELHLLLGPMGLIS